MTKINVKGGGAYPRALVICQNLTKHISYDVNGDQISLAEGIKHHPLRPVPLILMPGIKLTSKAMADAVAKLGTPALSVRSVYASNGEHTADFTVLFVTDGKAERYEGMRAWIDRDQSIYLIPGSDEVSSTPICFQFERGLRKVARPWSDEADRNRGLAEAMVLLLEDGADSRHG